MTPVKAGGQLFRVGEWYDSKVPMLILPALYELIFSETSFTTTRIKSIVLLLVFDCVFLAFGYLINDYADMDVDRKAGKKKLMHELPGRMPLLLVWGSVAAGCLPVLLFSKSRVTVLALFVIYFFGASYSAPPLRFKERGALGLFVSSTAQRCFPLLLLPAVLDTPVDVWYVLWMLLSFSVGIRYILVHQYIDAENDRKAGVKTYALEHQSQMGNLIRAAFMLELAVMVVLMAPICKNWRWTVFFLAGYAILSWIRWKGCVMVYGHGGLFSFDQVPLEDFYNQYLPLVFVILLMQQDMKWGILLAVWMLVLLRPAIRHLEFPLKILTDR